MPEQEAGGVKVVVRGSRGKVEMIGDVIEVVMLGGYWPTALYVLAVGCWLLNFRGQHTSRSSAVGSFPQTGFFVRSTDSERFVEVLFAVFEAWCWHLHA